MNPAVPLPSQATILLVDDEILSRTVLEYYLKKAGHHVIQADSAATARSLIAQLGSRAIHCVLTDYHMPGESGLELLLWIRQADPTLAVIMITATTEREIVGTTLSGGASDFLDKPVTETKLAVALASGLATTARRRRLAESEQAVREVGETQGQFFGLDRASAEHLTVCYHPCHAAGGDFVNFFPITADCFHILTGDVSGHDMNAAFVSAFFQGLARGMIEAGQPITQVLARFNQFLFEEGGRNDTGSSLAKHHSMCACVVSLDLCRRELSICNHGIPRAWEVSAMGQISPCNSHIEPPLGWFGDQQIEPTQLSLPAGGHLLVWTDGLEDLAESLEVNPCSIATRLLRAQLAGQRVPELTQARDDVLVVRINLGGAEAAADWLPVLHETYHGGQGGEIDRAQARWQRSLQLALAELSESRLFDILLTLRETVLNAIQHGCGGQPDQTCRVTVAVDTHQRFVRTVVSDSGPGHDYNWLTPERSDTLVDLHRGLELIHRLTTNVNTARNGAELTLDFSY
jgi:FixJ family two-component response regulator/anti-sigma regulatory factor (Ser/Thr protein kinase)